MDYRAWSVGPTQYRIHIAIVILSLTVLTLSGCSNSSESPSMNNSTVNSAELIDPSSEIAQIKFYTAEVDAMYQCLLSAATASANSRGLQAYPVVNELDPRNAEGVHATWCKTVGTSNAVDADVSSCNRYLTDDVSAPGTEALNLYADKRAVREDGVKRIELKSIKIPTQASTDFKVEFTRVRGANANGYSLSFAPFDGNEYNPDLGVFIGSYTYVDRDLNLREFYLPTGTIAEQQNLLTSSATQLKSITTSNFEILKTQVEQALNADISLNANARQAGLAKATTEIDRRIDLIENNSEAFHRLALEQFAIEQCG